MSLNTNLKTDLITELQRLSGQKYVEITSRGNEAIKAALGAVSGTILIPEEGGWLSYLNLPAKLGLKTETVKCHEAVIDLNDLKKKLSERTSSGMYSTFLYENPGGYFAEEPVREIYEICKENGCVVILDVSGALGTELVDSRYADIMVGSFGRWKPINAQVGGFISSNDTFLWGKISAKKLEDEEKLEIILEKIKELPRRVAFLQEKRKKVLLDLKKYDVLRDKDYGLVVVVRYKDDVEKIEIVEYCKKEGLEFTECPRYIRVNEKALSLEVKRWEE